MYSIVDPICDVCGNLAPCECRRCEGCRQMTADPVELDGDYYCTECAIAIATPDEWPEWLQKEVVSLKPFKQPVHSPEQLACASKKMTDVAIFKLSAGNSRAAETAVDIAIRNLQELKQTLKNEEVAVV